jgi:hypothetical protein
MKTKKFTKVEEKIRRLANRRARRQLTRVPRGRFQKVRDDYIRWQAFVLWVRAVIDSQGRVSPWLEGVLRKRCPGFLAQGASSKKDRQLDLLLREWIEDQIFWFAKEEGWLDALAFCGFQDPRLGRICAYWEHCESEWEKERPKSIPTFARWWHSALKWKLEDAVACTGMANANTSKRKAKRWHRTT